jgi:hypothetical protein
MVERGGDSSAVRLAGLLPLPKAAVHVPPLMAASVRPTRLQKAAPHPVEATVSFRLTAAECVRLANDRCCEKLPLDNGAPE